MKERAIRAASLMIYVLILYYSTLPAVAEEGGSGHCFPGSISDFIDTVPPVSRVRSALQLAKHIPWCASALAHTRTDLKQGEIAGAAAEVADLACTRRERRFNGAEYL